MAWTAILLELLCGAAIFAGIFMAIASLPMVVVLLVAIVTVHLPNEFSSIKLLSVDANGAHFGQPGYETDLQYLACLVALAAGGSGPLSREKWLKRKFRLQA